MLEAPPALIAFFFDMMRFAAAADSAFTRYDMPADITAALDFVIRVYAPLFSLRCR